MVEARLFEIKASDGTVLYAREWVVDGAQKEVARMLIVHGIGEHSGRYQGVADALTKRGVRVVSFDHRGHGKSGGKRVYVESIDVFLQDVDSALKTAQSLENNDKSPENSVPLFLYGHSMGGNIVLNYALRPPQGTDVRLTGVIASSPWVDVAKESAPHKIELMAASVVKKVVPGFSKKTGLDASFISRDPEEVKRYTQDELVQDECTIGLYTTMSDSAEWIRENAGLLSTPLYIYHGSGDKITSHDASKKFVEGEKHKTDDVTFRSWEGSHHETHHDLDRDAVIAALGDWILQRASVST